MDKATIATYERVAAAWRDRREPQRRSLAQRFSTRVTASAATMGILKQDRADTPIILDLGCGPGGHLGTLGSAAIGVDASIEMLRLAQAANPGQALLCADLEHLPLRTGSVHGAWASKSYVHLPRFRVPSALAELHRTLAIGGQVCAILFGGDTEFGPAPNDDFPGRNFSTWPAALLRAVFVGAGFVIDAETVTQATATSAPGITIEATSIRSSPDMIGAGMRLLACGINPSPASADSRVAYARPGNRFWGAVLASGLASIDRDPGHALGEHGLGFTDLVKRTTRKASEVTGEEFRSGMLRLEMLAQWLQPQVICFVGLSGYRSAVDGKAQAGPLLRSVGGCRAYLMPSTSGLNAHTKPAQFTAHLQAAIGLGESPVDGP